MATPAKATTIEITSPIKKSFRIRSSSLLRYVVDLQRCHRRRTTPSALLLRRSVGRPRSVVFLHAPIPLTLPYADISND
jgi:hypothetical protein